MSRAFVKEPDGDQVPDDRPAPRASGQPNYITPDGLERLREQLAALDAERARIAADDPRDRARLAPLDVRRRFLEARIAAAIVVDPAVSHGDEVRFGARVTVADDDGTRRTFTIVGEDEADPAAGRISWIAPLAAAVLGARVGDVVTWTRPTGAAELEVVEVAYGPVAGPR